MKNKVEFITGGTVTSPQGFYAGAVYAGIKKKADDALDLGILFSTVPCIAAGIFTANRVKAAPVLLCQERLQSGEAVAVVVNSGCANACTGQAGLDDACAMAEMAARRIGVSADKVLVASTGVIGTRLPMELIQTGMERLTISPEGGHKLIRAMMTTDTVPKEVAVNVGGKYIIGGVTKGAGMIHPDLATMLCFIATDAAVDLGCLKKALKRAVDVSFNMISVDGDTSTNDTVLILANGLAGNKPISSGSREAGIFQQALEQVCIYLAKSIARDGEGATRLIEVTVNGASSVTDARTIARTIVTSPLVKTAVYGADPNWGRVLAVIGRSGVEIVENKIDLGIGGICLVKGGLAVPFDVEEVRAVLSKPEVPICAELNLGTATATAWGCDLTKEYVEINSHYTT